MPEHIEDNSTSNTEEQSGSSTNEEAATLDLTEEAGNAAVGSPPRRDTRSLDDIELSDAQKASVDSYVNKAINDAVSKHDKRSKRKADEAGHMTREQVDKLLAERDAQNARRVDARERFLSVLGSEGITPGSEGYDAVHSAYKKGLEDGDFTPQILISDAGIRTLVAISGYSKRASGAAGAQSGLNRNIPATAMVTEDGSIQLNAKRADEGLSLSERTRQAVAERLRTL